MILPKYCTVDIYMYLPILGAIVLSTSRCADLPCEKLLPPLLHCIVGLIVCNGLPRQCFLYVYLLRHVHVCTCLYKKYIHAYIHILYMYVACIWGHALYVCVMVYCMYGAYTAFYGS